MEYFLSKKYLSVLFCLLLAILIFFLQNNLNYTKYKLNWDEVDYTNVASKGFLSNYLLLKNFELKYRHADFMFFVNKNTLEEEFALR